jgi:hypothetical protein
MQSKPFSLAGILLSRLPASVRSGLFARRSNFVTLCCQNQSPKAFTCSGTLDAIDGLHPAKRQENRRRDKEQAAQEKKKGEALMRSSLRRATVIMILLALFLAPGFLQARTLAWERASVTRPAAEWGLFDMVWKLLAELYETGVGTGPRSSGFNKNGAQLDPAGQPVPQTPMGTNDSDTGAQLDPAGGPKG